MTSANAGPRIISWMAWSVSRSTAEVARYFLNINVYSIIMIIIQYLHQEQEFLTGYNELLHCNI